MYFVAGQHFRDGSRSTERLLQYKDLKQKTNILRIFDGEFTYVNAHYLIIN